MTTAGDVEVCIISGAEGMVEWKWIITHETHGNPTMVTKKRDGRKSGLLSFSKEIHTYFLLNHKRHVCA